MFILDFDFVVLTAIVHWLVWILLLLQCRSGALAEWGALTFSPHPRLVQVTLRTRTFRPRGHFFWQTTFLQSLDSARNQLMVAGLVWDIDVITLRYGPLRVNCLADTEQWERIFFVTSTKCAGQTVTRTLKCWWTKYKGSSDMPVRLGLIQIQHLLLNKYDCSIVYRTHLWQVWFSLKE
jgi:hypothetical protein